MTLLIGALTLGFILSLLALGVFISFRIFDFPDITADGSITLGAAIAALLLVKGMNPVFASAAAFAGGFGAGTVTGTLATKFKINRLLAGILVMTAAAWSYTIAVVLARVQAIIVERERGAGWLESLIQFPAGGSA